MNREIPGYYYGTKFWQTTEVRVLTYILADNEKKKYFKIEKTHTAPSSAAWSSDAVKRRKVEHEAQKLAERQAHQVKKHIKRHFVARDTVSSALLTREIGLPYVAESGRGRVEDEDLGAAGWARGLVAKGNIPFAPSFARERHANMPCFYVSGEDEKTGLGASYATILYQRVAVPHEGRGEWMVHNSTPAPPSSDLICVASSNRGLLKMHSEGSVSVVAPRTAQNGIQLPQEAFAQDFQEGNHNVVFTGGRQPRLWITDLRAPEPQWSFANHASSISHIKSVNPHQVLASGLKSSMALYDVRYLSSDPLGTKPMLHFNGHRNEAHFHIGWDVSPELKVVAAAQDNGTVKLFSLRSGRKLRCPAVELIHTDTPVKALMFQRMPRERMPSLFVGEGPLLRKFSFGTLKWDDEA
ncbi:hypothetical protein FocTR4_00001760 [Fusarium oxysporum f. sp. cubense]|uniref:Myocyte-specific enhancer factor 2d n=1 Tax=Fusarium oxysporum f. sp. cubense TaxID=61366 RepID=A0A5C6T217_FUSOC|nr:hypothetical protein FocTR4_00001760 [Fusarium oxysporum f. sp. cubense]